MGRRPNQLIGEFFERGEKLEDASNRYQHICKRCGELFPKGRSNNLMAHLLRRCPNVTPHDRQLVARHYEHNEEPHLSGGRKRCHSEALVGTKPYLDSPLQLLQQQQQQQQSALDTLAEVSRRHLDYSAHPQRALSEGPETDQQTLNQIIAEQALITQLQQHVNALDGAASHIDNHSPELHQPDSQPLPIDNTFSSNDASATSTGLVQTASAATEELEGSRVNNHIRVTPALDPQLDEAPWPSSLTQDQSTDGISSASTAAVTPDLRPVSSEASQPFGYIAVPSKESTTGFGLLQPPTKAKPRSRFNDARRKEVRETRKRGACMRCRMLKKPCSDGTPCKSCRSVETARVWTGTCMRTRLSEECNLWSAKLYATLANVEMAVAGPGLNDAKILSALYARFCSSSDCSVTLRGRYCSSISPTNPNASASDADVTTAEQFVIEEGAGLPDKVGEYLSKIASDYIGMEKSSFVRTTLQHAQNAMVSEDSQALTKPVDSDGQQPRLCYNLQAELLNNAMELWVGTQLLIAPESHFFELRPDSAPPLSSVLESGATATAETVPLTTSTSLSSSGHRLIRFQLLAAIEAQCKKLSKTIMNELEKRILQRRQVSQFQTFLSAVILLNCIERMSGFYRTMERGMPLERPASASNTSSGLEKLPSTATNLPLSPATTASIASTSPITSPPITWPLDLPPSHFWLRGEHVSELVNMLLRIRGLPPTVTQTSSGTLAAMQDLSAVTTTTPPTSSKPTRPDRTSEQQTAQAAAAAWLDPLHLRVEDLLAKRSSPVPLPTQAPQEWDLRFVARVLLPERI